MGVLGGREALEGSVEGLAGKGDLGAELGEIGEVRNPNSWHLVEAN